MSPAQQFSCMKHCEGETPPDECIVLTETNTPLEMYIKWDMSWMNDWALKFIFWL